MKKTFCMDDVRLIFSQLVAEEMSTSRALEMLNEKADSAQEKAFEAGWRLRVSRKGSQLKSSWTQWREGSDGIVG